jgi:hypothetical protein
MTGSASALVPLFVLLALLAADRWVYVDAQLHAERGSPVIFTRGDVKVDTPAAWALGCLVLSVVFFPLYLARRR